MRSIIRGADNRREREMTERLRSVLRRVRNNLRGGQPKSLESRVKGLATFVCNLCAAVNRVHPTQLGREIPSCAKCHSTVRFRSIPFLLTCELFGEACALPD